MKTRIVVMAALVLAFAAGALAADNPFVGTWKLNVTKSKNTSGTLPNLTASAADFDASPIAVLWFFTP